MYLFSDEKRLDFPRAEGKGHKILLLDLQLKVDLSDLHEFKGASEYSLKAEKQAALLEKLRLICRFCQRKQVQILANQRVIDEDAKALVRGFGVTDYFLFLCLHLYYCFPLLQILPLERLGRDTCSNLQLLAGSRPLQSFDVSDPSLSAALGTVESIDHIVRGDESYVHFKGSQASDGGIWTLYVKALNEEDEEEARVCVCVYSVVIC